MEPINERHFRCFFGWFHVSMTMRFVLGYFVVFNTGLSLLRLPSCSLYTGCTGLAICLLTVVPLWKRNARLLIPLYCFVTFTIFYLLFLGGYFFFINIFYKEKVRDALGSEKELVSYTWHFAAICMLLLHFWMLGVISKCRRFFDYVTEGDQKVELPVRACDSRNNSKPELV